MDRACVVVGAVVVDQHADAAKGGDTDADLERTDCPKSGFKNSSSGVSNNFAEVAHCVVEEDVAG